MVRYFDFLVILDAVLRLHQTFLSFILHDIYRRDSFTNGGSFAYRAWTRGMYHQDEADVISRSCHHGIQ